MRVACYTSLNGVKLVMNNEEEEYQAVGLDNVDETKQLVIMTIFFLCSLWKPRN
jgi:hypothetical protein